MIDNVLFHSPLFLTADAVHILGCYILYIGL